MDEMIQIRADQATLNITWQGQNGDLLEAVLFESKDAELLQIAQEGIRGGSIPGIRQDPEAELVDFVVERFPATATKPASLMIRPKVPLG